MGKALAAYISLNEALREVEARFQAERDRRYSEVNVEREKALKIKEEADKAALGLAREIQAYKDEKANELREQINRERGLYATKDDLIALGEKFEASHKPVVEFMAAAGGRSSGVAGSWSFLVSAIAVLVSLIVLGTFVFTPHATSVAAAVRP